MLLLQCPALALSLPSSSSSCCSCSLPPSTSSSLISSPSLIFPYRRQRRQLFPGLSSSFCSSHGLLPLSLPTASIAGAPLIVQTASNRDEESNTDVDADPEEEEEEEESDSQNFIEVGYISKVHGLQGELRVMPSTDFPQLRFSQPGKRWLRTRVLGKHVITEVELTAGREHHGQKSWLVSLQGVDTVDKARQIVGSTLLVKEADRPELEEGEFYTPDLVGMRVFLKETGRLVGVVANVFNYGASDHLQVMLFSTMETVEQSNLSKTHIGSSGQLVWIPFVEAIVPVVDMDTREMYITPPKGLLELNLRTDARSKKERRQLEWKERKKIQHRLAAAKKKLLEMQQSHLIECLKVGDKAQNSLLIQQILSINFELFQHAICSISLPLDRFKLSDFVRANSAILEKNASVVSVQHTSSCASADYMNYEIHKQGLQLLMKSKVAIVVISNSEVEFGNDLEYNSGRSHENKVLHIQELILDYQRLVKGEGQGISFPLILVSPAHEIQSYEETFSDSNFFSLDSKKVWFLKEQTLPVVSLSSDNHKILMNSSCEILQAPIGSGGVFSLLSSHGITDKLIEMGVEYVQILFSGDKSGLATMGTMNLSLLGSVKCRGADMGISIPQGELEEKDDFNMVFSMKHLNKICKQIDQLNFYPVPERRAHVEVAKAGGDNEELEQIHPIPDEPNAYHLHSSISGALRTCPLENICIMYIASN